MKILLGLDPSEASQLALQEVAHRPWPSGTSIQVLTVLELYQPWTLAPIAEQVTASAHNLVKRGADLLPSRGLRPDGGSGGSENAPTHIAGRPWPAGTEVHVLSVVELGLSSLQAAFE